MPDAPCTTWTCSSSSAGVAVDAEDPETKLPPHLVARLRFQRWRTFGQYQRGEITFAQMMVAGQRMAEAAYFAARSAS